MKTEIRTAHFKISLQQMKIYRIAGAGSERFKKDLNNEINWRAEHLKIDREYSQINNQ